MHKNIIKEKFEGHSSYLWYLRVWRFLQILVIFHYMYLPLGTSRPFFNIPITFSSPGDFSPFLFSLGCCWLHFFEHRHRSELNVMSYDMMHDQLVVVQKSWPMGVGTMQMRGWSHRSSASRGRVIGFGLKPGMYRKCVPCRPRL